MASSVFTFVVLALLVPLSDALSTLVRSESPMHPVPQKRAGLQNKLDGLQKQSGGLVHGVKRHEAATEDACFNAAAWKAEFAKSPDASFRRFSQFNQDGVLKSLFAASNLGTTSKTFVEFGFPDKTLDTSYGNSHNLWYEMGFKPELLLDGHFDNPIAKLHKEWLTKDNIVSLFQKYGVSKEPDYVSIDIDSCDIWVFMSLTSKEYKPRVMTVEFNSNYGIDDYSAMACRKSDEYSFKGDNIYGASFSAIYLAAKQTGYTPVYASHGTDVFLVRDDLVCPGTALPLSAFKDATAVPMNGPYDNRFGPKENLVLDFKHWLEQNINYVKQ